jgi:hypothetical protein
VKCYCGLVLRLKVCVTLCVYLTTLSVDKVRQTESNSKRQKVKVAPEPALKAQRQSEGIVLLFL